LRLFRKRQDGFAQKFFFSGFRTKHCSLQSALKNIAPAQIALGKAS